jgi:HAD superfamily hydrolase (TIGR01509 family)
MIKVILFDADGVLIDNEYITVHLQREHGISQHITKEFFEGIYMDAVVGKKELRDILPGYLKRWGWKKSLDDFFLYWFQKEDIPNTQLITYIQKLRKKGVTCCLATNQPKERFRYMLENMQFSQFFDHTYASSLLQHKKPDPHFFHRILGELHTTQKQEVLFWDDSKENVEAGKEYGIHSERYTSYAEFQKRMEEYIPTSR